IHTGQNRFSLWDKNLAKVMESLTGLKAAPQSPVGWTLKKHHAPSLIQLTKAGDWVVVGLSEGDNLLLRNTVATIQKSSAPFSSATNFWLEAEVEPARMVNGLSHRWQPSFPFRSFKIALIGDGENMKTTGQLDFAQPVPMVLSPWNIPTN